MLRKFVEVPSVENFQAYSSILVQTGWQQEFNAGLLLSMPAETLGLLQRRILEGILARY
jgi:hypothetical protein